MNYKIISDSSCDLPVEFWNSYDLTIVPFYVSFDSEKYYREIIDMPIREFYQKLVDNPKTFPKSSMPSVQDYYDAFKPIVEAGDAIICICITTKFSGSMQSALTAYDMILEDYPDAVITVINSTINTVLQGEYVLEAVRLRDNNVPYEKAVEELERIKDTGRIFFTVGSLDYLQHGGRIGKLSGLAGSVLGIKPIITLMDGEIHSSGVARGRKKSLDKILQLLLDYLKENNATMDTYSLCIGYGYDAAEAEDFRNTVIDVLKSNGFDWNISNFPLYQIGATISVHTGPYPLGFGVIKKASI